MADIYEVIDLGPKDEQLLVGVERGFAGHGDSSRATEIFVTPFITEQEQRDLEEVTVPGSPMSALLTTALMGQGEWTRFTTEGEPTEQDEALALELAREVINLRGIKAARVALNNRSSRERRLVRAVDETEGSNKEYMTEVSTVEFGERSEIERRASEAAIPDGLTRELSRAAGEVHPPKDVLDNAIIFTDDYIEKGAPEGATTDELLLEHYPSIVRAYIQDAEQRQAVLRLWVGKTGQRAFREFVVAQRQA